MHIYKYMPVYMPVFKDVTVTFIDVTVTFSQNSTPGKRNKMGQKQK